MRATTVQAHQRFLERPIRVGLFRSIEVAEEAVQALLKAGFSRDRITVVCSDREIERHFEQFEHQEPAGFYTRRAVTVGAGIGVATGLLASLTLLLLTGAEGLWLPIGVLGALIGGVVGSFVGAMMTQGVEKELANYYDQAVPPGMILVAAEEHSDEAERLLAEAEHILEGGGAEAIALREG